MQSEGRTNREEARRLFRYVFRAFPLLSLG